MVVSQYCSIFPNLLSGLFYYTRGNSLAIFAFLHSIHSVKRCIALRLSDYLVCIFLIICVESVDCRPECKDFKVKAWLIYLDFPPKFFMIRIRRGFWEPRRHILSSVRILFFYVLILSLCVGLMGLAGCLGTVEVCV